jgi:uncharacterized protein (TIGR00369 family)
MSHPTDTAEEHGLGGMIGIEHLEGSEGVARARVKVTDSICQPAGVVHGGAHAAIAESVCSRATEHAVADEGMIALGQANQATFLRPISSGHIHAEARTRHRGKTTWVWDCELTDDDGKLCALVRMTIAVRPMPAEARR